MLKKQRHYVHRFPDLSFLLSPLQHTTYRELMEVLKTVDESSGVPMDDLSRSASRKFEALIHELKRDDYYAYKKSVAAIEEDEN